MLNYTDVTLYIEKRRIKALESALEEATGESLSEKLHEAFDDLYRAYVPDAQRATIEAEIAQEKAAEQAEREAHRTFAVCHVRENGEDHFFRSDAFHTTMYIANRYRQYAQGSMSRTPSTFADAFIDTEAISPQEYAKACENINYDQRITAIWEFNLDDDTIGICDSSDNAWNTYRLQDFSQAAYNVFQTNSKASDHVKNKIFNRSLAGKEIEFDETNDEALVDDGEDEAPTMRM